MRKCLTVALLVVALPAAAEFSIVEEKPAAETPAYTVYRDGNQIIVLTDSKKRGDWRKVAEARSPERAANATFRSQLSGKDMFYMYVARTRMLDGEPVCEKFFQRPADEAERKLIVQILSLGPCGMAL